ncbi:hypothetical protein BT93_B1920 [Corymbia citriodora subsp. variegata]|nr:hypothetical protein BT93_B1920 [Corymbia citriodora subsp. variegata]
MPTSKSHRTAPEDRSRRGKLPNKATSFHGRGRPAIAATTELRRPVTAPELRPPPALLAEPRPRLTKLLLNVTVLGSVGAVQVVMSPESTVGDLVAAVLRQYAKEGRRPTLASDDPSRFDLHYSQFSLESLDREEKLMALGSRNFFVCPKKALADATAAAAAAATSSCSREAQKAAKTAFNWFKFMDFLLP